MLARRLGLMISGASLVGGGLAVLVSACGTGASETHGFTYDAGGTRDASIGQPGDDDDDDDDDGDGGQSGDASMHADGGGGTDGGGMTDAAPSDSGAGDSSMLVDADSGTDSGPSSGMPTCDGTVSTAEYGGSAHVYMTGTQNWYMTWDATNLYVGIDTADVTQAAVMYLDLGAGGATIGTSFDGTDLTTLPFAADLVLYFKSGYAGYFLNSGAAWPTGPLLTNMAYKPCTAGSTREIVVPWSVVATAFSAKLPATFGFLGYLIGTSSYVYGQIPSDNVGGNMMVDGGGYDFDAGFAHYFEVPSTATGGSTPFQTPM